MASAPHMLHDEDDICIDVTLSLRGRHRRWVITPAPFHEGQWSYRAVALDRVTAGALTSREAAVDKRREFDQEIAAARAEGWR